MRGRKIWSLAILFVLIVCVIVPQRAMAATHGDFNKDGKVDSQDAYYLLRHVLNPEDYDVDQSADVNGDQKIDTKDALHLFWHTVDPNAYPLVENHEPVELPEKPATCTENGLTAGSVCKVCQKVLQPQTAIPALGHNYADERCTVCGRERASKGLQMELLPDGTGYAVVGIGQCADTEIWIPDSYNDLPVTTIGTQAFTGGNITGVTLGENIRYVKSCAFYRCESLTDIWVLAEDVVFDGSSILYECDALESVCFAGDPVYWAQEGFYLEEDVQLTLNYGHDYSKQILSTADCTHNGAERYTCQDCGRIYDQQTEALGHTYADEAWQEPTCTEDGSADGVCVRCGLYNKETLPAKGHSIASFTQQEAPTCESEGSEVGFCDACQQWYERAIPAKSHTVGAFAGTGEYCGMRELGSATCTVCNQVVYAVAHTLRTDSRLPSCTEDGYNAQFCENCTYSVSISVPATGHTVDRWEVSQKATCTADGVKVRKCTACDAVVETGAVAKCDHTTTATITDGVCTYVCQNCDYTESVVIENKFKVTFVSGCKPELSAIFVTADQVPELPIPVAEEYVFLGWYMDEAGTIAYEDTPIKADITLYALWSPKEITASDNGLNGVVKTDDTDYQFAVKSPVALTNENINTYITVTSSQNEAIQIFVAGSQEDVYYIGGNYAAGDVYEAVAVGGIIFEESGENSLWFVMSGAERENITFKENVVVLNKNIICGEYYDSEYDYVLTQQDILSVGQHVIFIGESEKDLYAIYEVVGKQTQGQLCCYQCVIPDPTDVFSELSLFSQNHVDVNNVQQKEGWEEAVVQSVRNSTAYAAFCEAATVYASEWSKNDSKYTYELSDFEIKTTFKVVWSSEKQQNELSLGAEVSCELKRKDKVTGYVVDKFSMSLKLEDRFGLDADICADGILRGDARVVITTHNSVTVDVVLKMERGDDDKKQEDYFRKLYQDACGKKNLLPIDTVPMGKETLVPACYVPIPLPLGFAIDVDVYIMLDWEVCGQFGVTYQHTNTMSFGVKLDDWDLSTVSYTSNKFSLSAYLSGKMRVAAGIRPEFGINWMKVVRVGANVTVSAYAECGGLVGFTVSNMQDIKPMAAGYIECGINLKAQIFGEIGLKRIKKLNYRFDYVLLDKDYPFFELGTKKMPMDFEKDGEEYVIYVDYDKPVDILKQVDTIIRIQNLGTMEIDREKAEKCVVYLEEAQQYVNLTSEGALTIQGCDVTEFVLEVRITSEPIYKTIIIHVIVDHQHEYTTTHYPGDCTTDEKNFLKCNNCTYKYWETVKEAPGHDYSIVVVDKYPTCTVKGTQRRTCTRCQHTITEAIPALGHDYTLQIPEEEHRIRAATCQNLAQYYYVCVNCGGHNSGYTYEYGQLGDHTYADPYTCHNRHCTTNGCTYTSVATTEHPWTDWIAVEPGGCATEACSVRACRDCSLTETDLDSAVINAHSWQVQPELAPTCYEPGYKDYILCTVCGEVANKTEVEPLEHNILYKDVTETTHVAYCHRAGCDYESEPEAHIYTGWTQVVDRTCEMDGVEKASCACGHETIRTESATGHDHKGVVTKEPTCAETGIKTYTCHCGDSYTETLPLEEHKDGEAVTENKKEATCTEAGSYDSVVYCIICRVERSRETITVKPRHIESDPFRENETDSTCQVAGKYDEVVFCKICCTELSRQTKEKELIDCVPGEVQRENETDSTCTEAGKYDEVTYCTMCSEELSRKTKEKELIDCVPGEVQIENETDSTCTEAGKYDEVTYCTVCGKELSRKTGEKELIDCVPGEVQIENETDSTCTEAGKYDEVTYCTMCSEELSRQTKEKELIDCVPGEVQIENETDSTCSVAGKYDEVTYCTVCGKELSCETNTKEALGHDVAVGELLYDSDCHWKVCTRAGCNEVLDKEDHTGEWTVEKAATCEGNGLKVYTCKCGYTTSEETAPTGHDHNGEWNSDGIQHYRICSVCNQKIDAANHKHNGVLQYSEDVHYRTCPDCKLKIDQGYHIPVSNGEPKEATCTEDGYTPYKCNDCGYTWNGDVILSPGHKWGSTLAYDGDNHYYTCTECGEPEPGTENPHTLTNQVTLEPTCTKPGNLHIWCITCGYETDEEITPDHDHSSALVNTNATQHYRICGKCGEQIDVANHKFTQYTQAPSCEETGYDVHTCTICGFSYQDNVTDPLGHSEMERWYVDAQTGEHYHRCNRSGCSYETKRQSHSYGDWETVKQPTCTKEGEEAHSCTVCQHKEEQVLPMLPHEFYEDVKTIQKAGTGETIYEHKVVTLCYGCDYEQIIGSTFVHVHEAVKKLSAIAPTCTETGLTTGIVCAVSGCTDVILAQETVPALGHDFQNSYCTRCGERGVSEGLAYTLSDDGTYYIVSGMGTCADMDLVIPGTYQNLPVKAIANSAFLNCVDLNSVVISDGVTRIGHYAFWGCSKLNSVVIPEGVTEIGWYAFYDCAALSGVTIPGSVVSIGNSAFEYCVGLVNVTISNGVTIIGDSAFYSCKNLVYLSIPNSVTAIGESAFCNCYNLIAVTIPEGVTSIGYSAFCGCSSLTDILIPNGVTSIDSYAFYDCDGLKSVTIANSVTSIGDSAFGDCNGLTTVIFCGTQNQWNAIGIDSNNKYLTGATLQLHNYKNGVCTICGQEYGDLGDHIPAADDSDCTTATVCEICGIVIIPATEHGNVEWVGIVEPTCVDDGYSIKRCLDCGTIFKDDIIVAYGHEATLDPPPNINPPGYTGGVYCARCGIELVPPTPPLDHEYSACEVVDATCIQAGYVIFSCIYCGDSYSEVIPINPDYHVLEETVIAPGCVEDGYTIYTCIYCGYSYTVWVPSAGGHEYTVSRAVPPTCTDEGYIDHICEVCGYCFVEPLAPLGHSHGEAVKENEIPVGTTTPGSYDLVVYCTACYAEISRETVIVQPTVHTHTPIGDGVELSEQRVDASVTLSSENSRYYINSGKYVFQYTCGECGESYIEEKSFQPAIFDYLPVKKEGVESTTSKYATCWSDNNYVAYKPTLVVTAGETYYFTTVNSHATLTDNFYVTPLTDEAQIAAGNWTIKLEYPLYGDPVLTLKNAKVINDKGLWYGIYAQKDVAPLTVILEGENVIASTAQTRAGALNFRTINDVTITGTGSLQINSYAIVGEIRSLGNLTLDGVTIDVFKQDVANTSGDIIGTTGGDITIKNCSINIMGFSNARVSFRCGIAAIASGNVGGNVTIIESDISIQGTRKDTTYASLYAAVDLTIKDSNLLIANGYAKVEGSSSAFGMGYAIKCGGNLTWEYTNGATVEYATANTIYDTTVTPATIIYPSNITKLTSVADITTGAIANSRYLKVTKNVL